MYDRGAWFLRVIMSSSRALCCLALAKKQKNDFNFSVQCIIKQLLDSVFVISRISVRVISLSLRLRLITPTSTSIILDIAKTSSNNCILITPIQPTKSKSLLVELINLIQIKKKKRCRNFADFFATLLICSQAEKWWVRCLFSHESGRVQLICHVSLTHYKTYIGGRSYSSTTDILLDFCRNKAE